MANRVLALIRQFMQHFVKKRQETGLRFCAVLMVSGALLQNTERKRQNVICPERI